MLFVLNAGDSTITLFVAGVYDFVGLCHMHWVISYTLCYLVVAA